MITHAPKLDCLSLLVLHFLVGFVIMQLCGTKRPNQQVPAAEAASALDKAPDN